MTAAPLDDGNIRGFRGRFTRSVKGIERDAEAARLRGQGLTYEEIANRLGFKHRGNAHRAVERAMSLVIREPAEALVEMEAGRLDALARELWAVIDRKRYVVSNSGMVVHDPATGEPLRDDAQTIAAVNALVRVSERRSKLLGLDAVKVKLKAETEITDEMIEAEVRKLELEIEQRVRRDAGLPAAGPPAGPEQGPGRPDRPRSPPSPRPPMLLPPPQEWQPGDDERG